MTNEPRFGLTTRDGRRPRVVVADGNPVSAMVATALVEQFGCGVARAESGEALLECIHRREPVDLILVDAALPEMDGLVAAQVMQAAASRDGIPIITLARARRPDRPGFSVTVAKPYSPRELYGAMQAALARAAVPVA